MMRRRWVIVVLCLFVSLLLISQLTSASGRFRVDEAATRMLLEEKATKVSLGVVNPLGHELAARVRLEVLDSQGKLLASSESDEKIKRGASALVLSLPLQINLLDKDERNKVLWYRLRYRITPEQTSRGDVAPIEGIVSLSEITPDLFELRIAVPDYTHEGARYHAQASAVHPISSRPAPGVKVEGEISFSDGEESGAVKASGVTNADGYASLDFDLPRRIKDDGELEMKVTATRGVIHDEAENEIRLEREAVVLMSTDKPLYQPGQTLHLRALCFDETKHALSSAGATLTIDDPEGTTVFRASLVTSRFGIASQDWPIPENTRLGDYTVKIELDDERYDEQETTQTVKISRYDLPNFAVNVKPDRAFYLPGQDAEVEVRADYLFGQPVKRGHVRVVREKERRWNYREQKWQTDEGEKYEGETDADGRFLARLDLQKEHADLASEDYSRYHDLTYAAYFTDPTTNRTEQRRFDVRVTKDAIHVYVLENIERQTRDFPMQFYLSTYYADGTPAECEVEIKDAGSSSNHALSSQPLRTIKTNRYGLAKVSNLTLPERGEAESQASLNFVARDRKGTLGHQSNTFWYADRPVIRIETDKPLYRTGDPIKATINASDPNMKLVFEIWKGDVALRSEVVALRDGQAKLTVPYSAEFGPSVTLTAYAMPDALHDDDNDLPAASRQVLYPREHDLRLNVELNQQTYKPGEDARAEFSVRAPDGRPVESALGIVVFDKAVEERARTDREFGTNYGFYQAYRYLRGYDGQLSGISVEDLFKLDLSKPVSDDVGLVAEVMLRTYAYAPRVFGSNGYKTSQRDVFAKLIEQQTAKMKALLAERYAQQMEYPHDAAALRAMLGAGGVDFEQLLDPWGTPYRAQFSVERETDVLGLVSAGADKRFESDDDFTALNLSWPYFRPLGENINRIVAAFHARTGGFIRDEATLKEELRGAGVDVDALRDRWGQPYRFDFGVNGTNYLINIVSNGPDGKAWTKANGTGFIIWTNTTDYFAEAREKIDAALLDLNQKTGRFPQNNAELRAALSRSTVNLDALRDPWGNSYYMAFHNDPRYTTAQTIRSYSKYGETGKLQQEVKPVVQSMNYLYVRSRGADGKEATADDFNVAGFSRTTTEKSDEDKKPRVVRPAAATYSGASGAISGVVLDMQDGTAAGVVVRATHLSTEQEYEALSDDEGRYVLRNLPVGLYRVECKLPGFVASVIDQVPVHSSNLTKLDVRLQIAGVSETVTVTAGRDVINASESAVSQSVSLRTVNFNLVESGNKPAQISTPRLRENFAETLLWQPSLETDAEGRARLDFKLADNITTWKMAVVGSTIDGEVGIIEREIVAFQPFFVEHDPPRILTEGDEIQLPVVIRNYLDKAQDVDLQIAPASWFALLGASQKRVAVPAGDSSRQTFDFRAVASVRDGSQQITANAEGGSDAIVKPVSVHPDGEERATTDSQIINDAATLKLNLPDNTVKDSARGELKIYPNLMAHVFESIEGILQRPYGCGEQTISSTYPSLLVLRHDRRTKQQSPIAPKALRYLRAGYERLLNYRTETGGFSYWGERQDADIALTAYALRFLNEAKEFIEVDEDVINDARGWLVKQQRADGSWSAHASSKDDERAVASLTAYVARVLAAIDAQATKPQSVATQTKPDANAPPASSKPAAPAPLPSALTFLSRSLDKSDEPYLLASYALAALDAADAGGATRALARLRALVKEEGNGMSYWELATSTPFHGWGMAGRIETTALVVQALARANQNDDALLNRGLLFLLRQKDRYGVWHSSQATINVLDSLITLLTGGARGANSLAANGEANAAGPVEVSINGRHIATIPMPPANQPASPIAFDLTPFLAPGENRLELQRAGKALPASVQAVATYYVPWQTSVEGNHPLAPAAASSALRLNVDFDKLEAGIGDEIKCRVSVERSDRTSYGMLLAEIGLPPGADVDRASLDRAVKDSNWTLNRYDILPDRLVVYLWPRVPTTVFEFNFRPRYGLSAQTAPSQVYDYYNPEAKAVVAPKRFVVK